MVIRIQIEHLEQIQRIFSAVQEKNDKESNSNIDKIYDSANLEKDAYMYSSKYLLIFQPQLQLLRCHKSSTWCPVQLQSSYGPAYVIYVS